MEARSRAIDNEVTPVVDLFQKLLLDAPKHIQSLCSRHPHSHQHGGIPNPTARVGDAKTDAQLGAIQLQQLQRSVSSGFTALSTSVNRVQDSVVQYHNAVVRTGMMIAAFPHTNFGFHSCCWSASMAGAWTNRQPFTSTLAPASSAAAGRGPGLSVTTATIVSRPSGHISVFSAHSSHQPSATVRPSAVPSTVAPPVSALTSATQSLRAPTTAQSSTALSAAAPFTAASSSAAPSNAALSFTAPSTSALTNPNVVQSSAAPSTATESSTVPSTAPPPPPPSAPSSNPQVHMLMVSAAPSPSAPPAAMSFAAPPSAPRTAVPSAAAASTRHPLSSLAPTPAEMLVAYYKYAASPNPSAPKPNKSAASKCRAVIRAFEHASPDLPRPTDPSDPRFALFLAQYAEKSRESVGKLYDVLPRLYKQNKKQKKKKLTSAAAGPVS